MIPTRANGQFLPPGWEQAYDAKSRRYFYVDNNTKTTTWLNPMDRATKAKSVSECSNDQLPYGWEKLTDPVVGTYYTNHIERKNQWSNPVTDWKKRMDQPHYSNSHHILSMELSANSLDSDRALSPSTIDKKDNLFQTPDLERSATSLNNSTNLDSEFPTKSNNNSTRGSRYDASLLDIMDNCFGRDSSHSVEV